MDSDAFGIWARQSIDLLRLRYDSEYYEQLRADIALRLFLKAELQKSLAAELDKQVLYGNGWPNKSTGVYTLEEIYDDH